MEDRTLLSSFAVNSTVDSIDANPGDGIAEDSLGRTTLRAAIMEANAFAGDDTITLGPGEFTFTIGGQYTESAATGDLDISSNITIIGAGSDQTTIDANQLDRVFDVASFHNLSLSGLTVTGGRADAGTAEFLENYGGAMRIDFYAVVSIEDCLFQGNSSPHIEGTSRYGLGGAISNNGDLTIVGSRFENNSASNAGGVIYVGGSGATTTIRETTFANNSAPSGGAIENGAEMTIESSTFVGNSRPVGSNGNGGAIDNEGTLTLVNSTLSGNVSDFGGGLINFETATIRNSTIAENVVATSGGGGGIENLGTLNLENTIVALNTGPNGARDDISGTVASLGHNLIGYTGGASGFVASDLLNEFPRIDPLADNGGPTLTYALRASSPAINAANTATAPATDQRGIARPVGTAADIGAFEFVPLPDANFDSYTTTENETLDAQGSLPAVDQANDSPSFNQIVLAFGGEDWDYQQQITAGAAGILQSIDLNISASSVVGDSFTFVVHRGAPWQSGAPEFSREITIEEGMAGDWITIDTSAAGIDLAAGEVFSIGVARIGGASIALGISSDDQYSGGTLWRNGGRFDTADAYDLQFRTRVGAGTSTPSVLANDTDPEGDPLTAELVSGPTHGTLSFNADGSFQYTPFANYVGTDSFTYRATDGSTVGEPATVRITVAPIPAEPAGPLVRSLTITYVVPPPLPFLVESSGSTTGTVTRSGDLTQDLVVSLQNSDPSSLTIPATVTIAAGQASADFTITVIDDTILDGTKFVTITASAGGMNSGPLVIDSTFGSDGLATTPLSMHWVPPYAAVTTLPDGKVLAAGEDSVAGSWRLVQLNADGSLDTTFGNGGSVVTPFTGSDGAIPRAIAVQPDGKILVGGESINGTSSAAILVRYNANGSLDTSFFNDGINTLGGTTGWIADIAVDEGSGKIYAAVEFNGSVDFKVVRLTASGFSDNTFGPQGTRIYTNTNARASSITVTSDGGFLVAGDNKVARFDQNGNFVSGFGVGGIATVEFGAATENVVGIAELPNGKIAVGYYLFAGDNTTDFGAARLNGDGTLDTTFSGDGLATADFSGLDDYATSMAVQSDGKIVLAGYTEVSTFEDDWAIARFGLDGELDAGFDGDGLFTQSVLAGAEQIFDIAVQGQELVVLGGWNSDFRVARYQLPGVVVSAERRVIVADQETLTVEISKTSFTEGEPVGVATMTITRNNTDIGEQLVVTPVTGIDGQIVDGFLILPESVTIAANETSVTFEIGVADDILVNGTREFQVAANAPNYAPNIIIASVADDDLGPFGAGNILVSEDGPNQILEYTPDGTLVRIFTIPTLESQTENLRDLAVDTDGNLHVWQEDLLPAGFVPNLTSLDPLTGATVPNPLLAGWSTFQNVTYGGVATLNDWVFVTDMISGGQPTGIIRYDRATGTSVRFASTDAGGNALQFIDLTIGLDGLLYGLDDFELVHVYDPATLAALKTVNITQTVFPDNRAIAVNAEGDIFAAAWGDNRIRKFDGETGAVLATSGILGDLLDIDLRSDGTIIASTQSNEVIVTDETLATSTRFTIAGNGSGPFVAFAATPAVANLRPLAKSATVTATEDVVLASSVSGSDPESATLTFAVVDGPTHGMLVLNSNGTFNYTPDANFHGDDSFTFTASDGELTSLPAMVSITVEPAADAPAFAGIPYDFSIAENSPNGASIGSVLATDVDGDGVTYSIVGGTGASAFAISATTGAITVLDAAQLDYEQTDHFNLIVRATEQTTSGLFAETSVTVDLLDVVASIAGRHLFYNNTVFDGRTAGAAAGDDAAIDATKSALLPGQTASFSNYSGYIRGITGVMIDVVELVDPAGLTAADFLFRVGDSVDPSTWATASAPLSISVRDGAGLNGSDRVTLIWADGAIRNTWLQVTVLANERTGLAAADVHYWGNQAGETGNVAGNTAVNAADASAAFANLTGFTPAGVGNQFDVDKSNAVNAADASAIFGNLSGFTSLSMFTAPAPAASEAMLATAPAGSETAPTEPEPILFSSVSVSVAPAEAEAPSSDGAGRTVESSAGEVGTGPERDASLVEPETTRNSSEEHDPVPRPTDASIKTAPKPTHHDRPVFTPIQRKTGFGDSSRSRSAQDGRMQPMNQPNFVVSSSSGVVRSDDRERDLDREVLFADAELLEHLLGREPLWSLAHEEAAL